MFLRRLSYLMVGVVVTMLLVGVVILMRSRHPEPPLIGKDSPRAKGRADAPIQIIEYSDFQCPACKTAQSTLSSLFAENPGKVRIVFLHFPLENHRWSPLAHQAAECAAHQDRFWEYHDRLYSDQEFWSSRSNAPVETLMTYAKEADLNLDVFSACLGNPSMTSKIKQEKSTGIGLGVRSTPSFFVNGELVVGHQNLKLEVEKQLKQ